MQYATLLLFPQNYYFSKLLIQLTVVINVVLLSYSGSKFKSKCLLNSKEQLLCQLLLDKSFLLKNGIYTDQTSPSFSTLNTLIQCKYMEIVFDIDQSQLYQPLIQIGQRVPHHSFVFGSVCNKSCPSTLTQRPFPSLYRSHSQRDGSLT